MELFDPSESIEERLLKSTFPGGRLKEALRSRKQVKKKNNNKQVKNVCATVRPTVHANCLCICLLPSQVTRHVMQRAHALSNKMDNYIIVLGATAISNFARI